MKIKSCCNYDQNCPEWTVIKNKFILVDDWNTCVSQELENVDMWLDYADKCKNANGVKLQNSYLNESGNLIYISAKMTQDQLEKLKKDWAKWKKDNSKFFK